MQAFPLWSDEPTEAVVAYRKGELNFAALTKLAGNNMSQSAVGVMLLLTLAALRPGKECDPFHVLGWGSWD